MDLPHKHNLQILLVSCGDHFFALQRARTINKLFNEDCTTVER